MNGDPLWLNAFGHILKQGYIGSTRNPRDACHIDEAKQAVNKARILLNDAEHGCLKSERIVQFITNRQNPKFDLRPYKNAGNPGWMWEMWEVKQAHWDDPSEECRTGSGNYGYGVIDENGTLVGLMDEFESHYSYNGYMILSQGPFDCTLGGWRCECNVYRQENGRITICHMNTITTPKN